MLPHIKLVSLAFAATACGLAAQDTQGQEVPRLGPRSFFPKEYTTEYYVDVDALQDTIVWDALERSVVAGPMRTMFRKEFGFRLDDILRVRSAGRYLDEKEAGDAGPRDVNVTVIEGKGVRLPPAKKAQSYLKQTPEKIRGVDVVREAPPADWGGWPEGRLYAVPKSGVLVIGSEAMIRSVLEGKRRGGVISARLMALTARRKPLGYVALGFPAPSDPRYEDTLPFEAGWHTDRDPLEHLIARLHFDEKTENITIKTTMRFRTGKKGPEILQTGMKEQIEAMKEQKIYGMLKLFFKKISWQQDGQDLHMAIELDKGDLGNLISTGGGLPWVFMSAAAPAPVMVAPVKVEAAKPLPKAEKPLPKAKKPLPKAGKDAPKASKKK